MSLKIISEKNEFSLRSSIFLGCSAILMSVMGTLPLFCSFVFQPQTEYGNWN